jgi:hypothetical protein
MADDLPQNSTVATADTGQQSPQTLMDGEIPQAPGEAAEAQLADPQSVVPPPPLKIDTMYIYAAVAAIIGVLAGIVIAVIFWGPAGHESPYDLGTILSSDDGLTGHLVLTWDKNLSYRLVVGPNDPVRMPGFSQTVNNAPRPFSVDIQLKDSAGSVLCAKTALLKFDPRQAAALAATNGSAALDSAAQAAHALDIAGAEAQELTREHDQDVFQNDLDREGQTETITAQGPMPCSKQAFDRTVSWNFLPNFLTVDQQAELQNHLNGIGNENNAPPAQTAEAPAAPRKKTKKRASVAPAAFAIEGDDELVAFDFAKGMMETSGRKFFAIDKLSVGNNLAAWQDVPANIHYRCDLNSLCIIKRAGAGVLFARLRR